MTALSELSKIINQKAKNNVEISTTWAVVKSVDWAEKTCVCTGELDDLDYYDVLLGIGEVYLKPVKDTTVLLGIINGNAASAFIIHAEQVEEIETTTGTAKFIQKKEGFIVKKGSENLKAVLNDMIDELNKIIVIQGTTLNVPAMKLIQQRLNTILTD